MMKNRRMFAPYPLYHGTNTKAQNMSEIERKSMYKLCDYVGDVCYDYIINKHIISKNIDINIFNENIKILSECLENCEDDKYKVAKDNIDNLFSDIEDKEATVTAIRLFHHYKTRNTSFEYGDMYLTLDLDRAKEYAKTGSSFGEFSVIVNNLYVQAKSDGLLKGNVDTNMILKLSIFEEQMKDSGEPIVLKYERIYEDELLHENGVEITEKEWELYAALDSYPNGFRVKKDVDLKSRLKEKIFKKD